MPPAKFLLIILQSFLFRQEWHLDFLAHKLELLQWPVVFQVLELVMVLLLLLQIWELWDCQVAAQGQEQAL
jgi:hypothetical protein